MSYEAGTAFLQIVPSFKGLVNAINAQMEELGESAGKVFASSFNQRVKSDTNSISLGPSDEKSTEQGSSSGGAFADGFKARVEAALKSLPDVDIDADSTEADIKIDEIRTRLETLRNLQIGVDISDGDALLAISVLKADLDRLRLEHPTISVRVDTSQAIAELSAFETASAGGGSGVEGGADDLAGLSDAAGPVGAVAALSAVVALGGVAAGVLQGVAASALAGATGLGVFGAAASDDLGQLETDAKSAFAAWQAGEKSVVSGAVNDFQGIVGPALQSLDPIVKAVAGEVGNLGVELQSAVKSPGWTTFTDWIAKTAPGSIAAFTIGLGDIGAGIAGMAENSTPLIDMVDRGFVSLGHDIDNFGQSNDFKDFVAWVVQNAPAVGRELESIGVDVGHLITAFAPLGLAVINVLANVSNDVRDVAGVVVGAAETAGHALDDVFGSGALAGMQKTAEAEQKQVTELAAIIDGTSKLSAAQQQAALSSASLSQLAQANTMAMEAQATAASAGISGAAKDLGSGVSTISGVLDAAGESAFQMQKHLDDLDVSAKTLASDQKAAASAVQSSWGSATDIVSAFSGQTDITAADVKTTLDGMVTQTGDFAANVQKAISEGYSPALISQLLEAGPQQAGPILQSLVSNSSAAFVSMVNGAESSLSSITDEAVEEARLLQVAIHASNSDVTANYTLAMEVDQQIMSQGASATVASVARAMGYMPSQIQAIMAMYGIVLKTGADAGTATMGKGGSDAGSAYATGLSGQSGAAGSAAQGVLAAATGPFANVYNDFLGFGTSAGQGFAKGILAEVQAAMNATANLFNSALSEAHSILANPPFPSAATQELGRSFSAGFAVGIDAEAKGVMDAVASMFTGALGQITAPLVGAFPSMPVSSYPESGSSDLSALSHVAASAAVASVLPPTDLLTSNQIQMLLPAAGATSHENRRSIGDVTINAETNASATDIAYELGWLMKTI